MAHDTNSFEQRGVGFRFRVLPTGVGIGDVARDSRRAGLAFLRGAAAGCSREQLLDWLRNDYEAVTSWTRVGGPPRDPTDNLDDWEVPMFVERARQRVVRMLECAAEMWSAPAFTPSMIDARLIVVVYDRMGVEGYAPASQANTGLVHRVVSLFVADYLARPADYGRLSACEGCGEIAIGAHPDCCVERPRESGIVPREGAESASAELPARRAGGT
jgi:hypothetical protein